MECFSILFIFIFIFIHFILLGKAAIHNHGRKEQVGEEGRRAAVAFVRRGDHEAEDGGGQQKVGGEGSGTYSPSYFLSRSILIFCICLFSLLFFSNFILQAAREEAKSKAAEFSSMSERLATLEAQVILLQKQLEREKTDKADKEKQLAKEHTETERLKKEVAEERGGKESETREKERAEKELEVEREEVKKLRAKNEELEAELKVANDRPKLSVCLRSVVS